jgi:protoporphyrin/coproporphyrin ferrochelatase
MTTLMPESHPILPDSKIGVLLINLGTPDGTGFWAIRRYLNEFLSDRRVIEMSPFLWQPLLQGIILTFRPKRSGRAYRRVWDEETDESPLRRITREQAEILDRAIGDENLIVDWAMRYGRPSIQEKLDDMQRLGCQRILLLALYPQYSATTIATAYDKAFDALKKMRWQPAIRTASPYYDQPVYINALKQSLESHLQTLDWKADAVLASFHGLPKKYFEAGDPYYCHCAKTTRMLQDALGYPDGGVQLTFQSRFGPAAWLEPYTDDVLASLAADGKKNVVVITPGFSADCLETLDEIDRESSAKFLAAGGEQFSRVPCLNGSANGIDVLKDILRYELSGWRENIS